MASPFADTPESAWQERALELIGEHPLIEHDIVDVALRAWDILAALRHDEIDDLDFGMEVLQNASAAGTMLERVIAHLLARERPGVWRAARSHLTEKDLVCMVDRSFDTEVKTCGQKNSRQMPGNASHAKGASKATKDRSGFHLSVNYDRPSHRPPTGRVRLVRLGWIDAEDWNAQKSGTGQRADCRQSLLDGKLVTLYDAGEEAPPYARLEEFA